jgi:hypothetical protein
LLTVFVENAIRIGRRTADGLITPLAAKERVDVAAA